MKAPEAGGLGEPGPTRTNLASDSQLEAGSLLAGRYRIGKLLGVGGMGMVYQARDEELDLDIAVKTLRPELSGEAPLIERFRRELVLARQVTHRNVVRIHDLGQDGDLYFITMDLVTGRSLRDLLEERGKLDVGAAVEIAKQLAQALSVAHEQGVVHRDLKPSNVMVDEDGRAYITDFGVARSLAAPAMTRAGAVVGTLDYLSPEQARGDELDGRTDLYSLGVILFEMLSGDMPFRGGTFEETMAQKLGSRPRDLRTLGVEVPPAVRAITSKLLERNRARRFADAAAVAQALEQLSEPRGRWVRLVAAALLVIALGLVAWAYLARRQAAGPASPTAATAAAAASLAVLPFEDETGLPQYAWVAHGVPDMLAEALAESSELRVAAADRVGRALNDLKLESSDLAGGTLRRVAELFDSELLLAGRVRTAGDELRIEPRLWAITPTGELTETVLEPLQGAASRPNELVEKLAAAVRGRLELPVPEAATPIPASPGAVASYSRGVESLQKGDAVNARVELERAVAEDDGFAAAWLRLAEAYVELGLDDQADAAAQRAAGALGASSSRLAYEARALQARLEGDPETSRALLEELTERFPYDLDSRVALADAYGQEGDLKQAIDRLARIAAEAPNNPRAWYLLSKYSILAGDARRAVDEFLVPALVIQNKLQNRQGQADVLNAFGVAYRELREMDLAEENYRKAAALRLEIGDRRGYATSLRNVAQIDAFRGRFEPAAASLDKALAIFEEIGDVGGIADLRNERGLIEEARGRWPAALQEYRRSLELRRQLGDQRAVAESLNNVGFAYYQTGEYDNASVYWQQALDLFRQLENQEGEILVTQSLGELDIARGRWDEATRSYLAALEAAREVGFDTAIAVSLGSLGRIAHLQGRYPAALSSFREALEVLEPISETRGLVEFSLAEAATLLALGLAEDAGSRLDRADELLETAENHEQQSELLRLRGRRRLEGGDRASAATMLKRSLSEARASENRKIMLQVELDVLGLDLAGPNAASRVARASELDSRAEELGHFVIRLGARESLARAQLAAGDAQAARRSAESALRDARSAGAYGGSFRLYGLLAAALDALGEVDLSAAALQSARDELERMRSDLDADQRTAFDRANGVETIERDAAS